MNNLLQELYKTYQVEPHKIPKEIPSTSEVIGYDIEWQELTNDKIFKIIDTLLNHLCFSIKKFDDVYYINVNMVIVEVDNKVFVPISTHEAPTLKECMIVTLLGIYNEIPEHYQLAIRNILSA